MISVWLRVIRIRFLLASVIAVSLGLAINWWHTGNIEIFDAILTMCGVLALHASVDLLNDYWDFKRGIDTTTQRTKMSGGTGVLPEGLLKPKQVYAAGIIFLIAGAAIGAYFVFTDGIIIGLILAFAVLSVYFYSTKIVDWGLAEIFIVIKGTMIVIGTYFIQTTQITESAVLGGIVVGTLSSFVLFITSFPDHDADKAKGRKTLVINLGKQKACSLFWVFPIIFYSVSIFAIIIEVFPIYCLIILSTIPLVIKFGKKLKQNYEKLDKLLPIMSSTLVFSRVTGILLVVGFLLNVL
uniref:UbiA prenyltransferase (MenA) n=1 Tax=uncultured marine thaumarchaeote KM3_11_E10 TaxID=1455991 RepID=A0A075G883_9ARCH|nr:UbiA prenyltransferase (menA) [uncultured marine thaumarchaeote KM3_11_E10]